MCTAIVIWFQMTTGECLRCNRHGHLVYQCPVLYSDAKDNIKTREVAELGDWEMALTPPRFKRLVRIERQELAQKMLRE